MVGAFSGQVTECASDVDPFSLLLSREANVVVNEAEFGATLTQSLKQTMEADGLRILRDNWKQQPAYLRFMSWLSYGLLRLMMGISGYARKTAGPGTIERLRRRN